MSYLNRDVKDLRAPRDWRGLALDVLAWWILATESCGLLLWMAVEPTRPALAALSFVFVALGAWALWRVTK